MKTQHDTDEHDLTMRKLNSKESKNHTQKPHLPWSSSEN